MNLKSKDMDMLHGALTGKLLYFTLPIALSCMIQQLFNAADTAVVGYFGNAGALAAVGTNTEILIVTVSSGLSIGINILIANHIGRNEAAEIPAAIQTAMLPNSDASGGFCRHDRAASGAGRRSSSAAAYPDAGKYF
mgnify:CR=1 FL=1